ncbi:hypothetical protein PFISCL1PPCAC_3681, partial [Pristionchus fissidentatus]
TTTTPPPLPIDTPPTTRWMLDLRSFYNYNYVHAFAADEAGIKIIERNGIGNAANALIWSMGYTLAENRIEDMKKICGAAHKLKKLYFSRRGKDYFHQFGSERRGLLWMGSCGAQRMRSDSSHVPLHSGRGSRLNVREQSGGVRWMEGTMGPDESRQILPVEILKFDKYA